MPNVKYDQTVTIRINEAKKKAHGTSLSQCSGGCGRYLTEEAKSTHQCPGPRRIRWPKRTRSKKALSAAKRKAAKARRSI